MISKELFIETINKLKEQFDWDTKCAEKFGEIFPTAYPETLCYRTDILFNQTIKILQVAFNDDHANSWIEHFFFELEFGAKNDKLKVRDKDGKEIPLSTPEDLYNLLTNKR